MRHANSTSFKPGNKRSPEALAKQSATLKKLYALGLWKPPGVKWTEERKAKYCSRTFPRRVALGDRVIDNGYWKIMTPRGRQYEHRVIMAQHLGRELLRSEIVHHLNHDKLDNRLENLELTTASAHSTHHGPNSYLLAKEPMMNAVRLKPGQWSRKYTCCITCGLTERPHTAHGVCRRCHQKTLRRERDHTDAYKAYRHTRYLAKKLREQPDHRGANGHPK
jgi:hypothetical protein